MGFWNRWRAARQQRNAARRAAAFWNWFLGTAETLLDETPATLAARIEALNERAAAYHPTLRALLGRSDDGPELILTCEGNPAGAEHVRFLAASQPSVQGWRIRAFKPPLSDCKVSVGPITLTADDVDFAVIDVEHPDIGELTLLLLFVPGLAVDDADDVRMAATKLLEALLGEERFLHWSGRVVMEDRERPDAKVTEIERHPLRQIAAVVRDA